MPHSVATGRRPRIGLLLGDPSGIGPEVAAGLLSLAETARSAEVVVIGDPELLAAKLSADIPWMRTALSATGIPTGIVSAQAGAYVLETLRTAVVMLREGELNGMVFAPLNKQAMKLAGMPCADELHYFAELLAFAGPVSEINVMGGLWTSRVTSHVPLRDVADLITADRILEALQILECALQSSGVANPRIAVAALNPHAGEGGTLGTEEQTIIGPAIQIARDRGLAVTGPLPSDTLFIAARRGDYDGVVTMYHDQGQIALKLLGFNRGVTVAGGLPVVITTPAHGTAFDIAGQGKADIGPIREAFRIACAMATST